MGFFSVCSGFIYLLLLLVSLNYLLCAVGLLILVNILNNHKPCRQDLGSPSKPNHLARALTNQTWGTDPLLFGHNMSQTSDFWEEASIWSIWSMNNTQFMKKCGNCMVMAILNENLNGNYHQSSMLIFDIHCSSMKSIYEDHLDL